MYLNINSTILKTFPAFLLNSNVPDPTDGVTSRTGSPCAPGARLKVLAINTWKITEMERVEGFDMMILLQ